MLHGPRAYFSPSFFHNAPRGGRGKEEKKSFEGSSLGHERCAHWKKRGNCKEEEFFFLFFLLAIMQFGKQKVVTPPFLFLPFFATMLNERWKLH